MEIGDRVTWFCDPDQWGTVTAVDDSTVTVVWDGLAEGMPYGRMLLTLRRSS